MTKNYFKHITIFQNDHSIVKLLAVIFLIAKKLKACILSPVPASTQRTYAVNLSKSLSAIIILFLGFASSVFAQSPQTFSSSGTFTVPTGVTAVKVECWGGGGAGGQATGNPSAGGGGAGGSYASSILTGVTGSYTVTVGTAKASNNSNTAANGNPSWFGSTSTVYAIGGPGGVGVSSNNSNGTAGAGTTVGCIGTIVYKGGDGSGGNRTSNTPGGAGGGGGGSTGNGGNASGGNGGTGTTLYGGDGADGVANSTAGATGNTYGGGGSGGKANGNTDRAGGSGASGAVIVSWITVSAISTATCTGQSIGTITVTASGGTSTYTYSLNSGTFQSSNLFSGLASGAYTVTAIDANGLTSTTSVTVTANPLTSISSQSTSAQTQCVGGSFTPITVTATGTGTLTYQWYSNATASTTGGSPLGTTNGAQTSSYTPQAATTGTLYYYCIVTGTCSTVTSAASGAFLVNPATAINSQSTNAQTQCVGGSFTPITVTATGTGTLTYQWYSNATATTTGGTSLVATNGAQTNSYTPQSTTAGTLYYYCIVTGTCATATSAASGAFLVNPATTISSQSTGAQTQCIGGSFTPITVTTTGAGLTYQWYRNTTASTTGGTSLVATNGAQTNSYTPQSTSAGTLYYYCIVNGTCGTATSAASGAFLVNPATTISSQSTNAQTQCVGGSFTPITVTATGTGILTYQWYSNTTSSIIGGVSLGATNGAQTNSYTPQTTTAGTLYYYCIVTGTCATATSTASGAFLVNPILPVSVSVAASANPVCVGTSVTFTATPTNGGTIPSFQWKVNGTNAGTNSSTYLYTPANNDLVTCVLTSNASPCAAGTPATSNTVTITVTPYPSAPTTTGAYICIGTVSGTTLSASGAVAGQKYNWYSAATGGTLLYTSADNTVNTYITPVIGATTSYWVTILSAGGCESPRAQVTATYPSVCTDAQTPGTDTWNGYVYSGQNTNFASNIYFGHYTEAETFNESFGTGNDNFCFSITSNSNALSINTVNFAVRYLMTSSRKGLYAVDLGSDDGSRLTVDGNLLYNNWVNQGYAAKASVLMNLTGSSSLIYDYYENGGANQVVFQNLVQLIANNLSTNVTQTINMGNTGTAISGDVFNSLPTGITVSGTGYQWTYSTTPGGARTAITGATAATYTPTTTIAPFNTPGTFYLYRNAVLSSTNNVSPTTWVATNESNAATITIGTFPTITTSVSSLTGFTYVSASGPSAEQSFTVSGIYLTTNITITPPANFEISTGTGASFVPSSLITLNVVNSTVATTTIYVRMKAGLLSTPLDIPENIILTSTGATTQNVACSGTVIVAPVITISTSTLSGFNYNFSSGGPSASLFFNVSGTNLTGNIVITPPANYQISLTSGGVYTSSITLTQSGGSVPLTPIYVRLISALVVNTYSGNVVLTSPFATTKNMFCSGSVTAPIVTVSTFNLAGFIYTLGSGPSESQMVSVSGSYLTNNVILTAPTNFEISTDDITYYSTLPLTPAQVYVTYGMTIYVRMKTALPLGFYGPGNLTVASTGAITQNVICSGKVVNTATLLSSVASLNGFMYLLGSIISGDQSFTVSGASLTADITVTAPANYVVSSDYGANYYTSVTLSRVGNIVTPALIYIHLIVGLPVASYSGNLVITSGTAPTVNVACSGKVLAVPTITAWATPGATVCIGNTVNLNSSTTGGVNNFYWTSPNGYYSQASAPPVPITGGTVSATDAGIYTITGSVLSGVNLLTNGDFESGTVGFGSSYGYVVPSAGALMPEGVYTIVGDAAFPTPNSVHNSDGGFGTCTDHTHLTVPAAKHEMVINGSGTAGVIVWSESVSVQTGTDYQFSYYIESVNGTAPSQLQLYVNGMPAGPVYTASTAVCGWNQFIYNTNSDINSVLQLTLINQNTATGGNDFALDDMMFQQVFTATSSVNLSVNPVLTPGLTVTASSNPVYTNTPVTFTATPTNGGTTPTYQWSVGGVAVPGATGSTYNSTPTNGQVVSCVMTSSLACTTTPTATSSVTMTVNQRSNYWLGSVGANGTDWGTATNWTALSIPAPGNDVEYATTSNAAGKMAVNSLQLDQDRTIGSLINATTQSLIIPAGKGLIVNQMITTNGDPGLINIKSLPSTKNGSLIYHNPLSKPVFGTVEMYSLASYNPAGPVNGKYQWQYFGIPLNSVVANPTFYQSYVRSWDESGNSISTHWVSLINSSTLSPFYGYEITQQYPVTVVFRGQLVNSDSNYPQLSVTSSGLFPGQHIYANPYTAAINITQLKFGSDTEATVYLYNTGSYNDWYPNGQSSPGNNPGQYTAVTKNTAGHNSIPGQIPSMQGFLVKAMTPTSTTNCTFGFTYNSVVINNTDAQRAPGMYDGTTDTNVSTMIDLRGTNYEDRMWLFTQPGCTRNFDNGWDGYKMSGNVLTPQIYAIEPDGNYQVDAVEDINNTILGFQAGEDTEYTMTFTHVKIATNYSAIFLVDLVENKTVDITENGSTYSFVSESTPVPVKRFMIATRNIEKDAPDANTQVKIFSSGHVVFVQNLSTLNGEMIVYDMMGHLLKRSKFGPSGTTAIQMDAIPGAYVVAAATSNERVSKRVILGK